MTPLFQVVIRVGDNNKEIANYDSVVECIDDRLLAHLLDSNYDASCELWSGDLKISSSPIKTSQELRDSLVDNAQTILHGLRS